MGGHPIKYVIPQLMALWVSETDLAGRYRHLVGCNFVPDSRLVLPREQSMLEHSRAINLDTSDAICAPGLDGLPLERRGVAT